VQDSPLRAYVSGSLTGQGADLRELYEGAAQVLSRAGFVAYVPHLATDPVRHPDVTPAQVYETDRREVATADLVVVFLGRPSFGVGQELEIAADALVPLLLIAPERDVISRMALGGRAKHYGPLRYREWEDLEAQLLTAATAIAADLRDRRQVALPSIGDRLRRARTRAGMARMELATRLGVSAEFVRLVETADPRTSNPSLAFLAGAADALGSSIAELLGAHPTGTDVITPLRTSLEAYALQDRLSYREYADLREMAARGLESNRSLAFEEWREIRRARTRPAIGEQLELPTDARD
jgi:2'-deoxynucleoside 5'-phosphate N-hydrolase